MMDRISSSDAGVLVGVMVAVALSLPGPLSAQSDGESDGDANLQKFNKVVKKGYRQYKKKNYREALESFRAAQKIIDHPNLDYKIGRTLEHLNRCEQAEERYRSYLARDLKPKSQKKGQKRLDGIDETCTSKGTLSVECRPSDVEVEIRVGDRTETCPATLELPVGEHRVGATAEGHAAVSRTVTVTEGETVRETLTLEPKATAGGTSTDTGGTDTAGGGAGWPTYAGWSAVGLGVAALTGGVLSDRTAETRHEQMGQALEQQNRSQMLELRRQSRAARTRTIVLYAAGGAVLAGGAGLLVADGVGAFDLSVSLFPTKFSLGVTW